MEAAVNCDLNLAMVTLKGKPMKKKKNADGEELDEWETASEKPATTNP